MSDIRQASVEPGSDERLPGPLAQAGPFVILLYTFNFGHPGAIALTVLTLLLPLLAVVVALLTR